MYYVYILECKNGELYTGCTSDLEERIERHKMGFIPVTKDKLPIELKTYIVFENKYLAYNFERYLKSGSGRAFLKKRLI